MIELFGMVPLRAEILRWLSQNPQGATSGAIGRALGANYRTVAKHLVRLEDLGVIESDADDERQGVRVIYRVSPDRLAAAFDFLQGYIHGE